MAVADVTAETGAYGEGYHFLVRRLHSLSGIIPVGVFICIHMLLNGAVIAGRDAYQNAVDLVHSLEHVGILKLVEVVFIFIPIAFHAILGITIALTGQSNVTAYRYGGNVRYTLQRWTAWITLVFIMVHLIHVHWIGTWIVSRDVVFNPGDAVNTGIAALQGLWWGPVYAVGLLCAVFHFANGVWTFLIVWGITIGPRSQQLSGRVCIIIGIVLGLLGMGSLLRLKTMDVKTSTESSATQVHTAALDDEMDRHE